MEQKPIFHSLECCFNFNQLLSRGLDFLIFFALFLISKLFSCSASLISWRCSWQTVHFVKRRWAEWLYPLKSRRNRDKNNFAQLYTCLTPSCQYVPYLGELSLYSSTNVLHWSQLSTGAINPRINGLSISGIFFLIEPHCLRMRLKVLFTACFTSWTLRFHFLDLTLLGTLPLVHVNTFHRRVITVFIQQYFAWSQC